ncbi:MAG: zinc ribbon domain-containing protein [Thaumarchaeota archaeon]|nr:zinc ribbon domain-containing protein [Nitrososphaerota archaeon]
MPRTPTQAAALDFFIWGVGHAYVGRRRALMFPWFYWTLGLAAWNIIGAILWYSGAFYSGFNYFGTFVATSKNVGAAFAFFFIPTLIVGGLLALDVYRSEKSGMAGGSGTTGFMNRFSRNAPTPQSPAAGGNFCMNCGAANTPGDAFCANCGAPMAAQVAAPATPTTAPMAAVGSKVCANCGATNPAGNAFCKRCGTRLA